MDGLIGVAYIILGLVAYFVVAPLLLLSAINTLARLGGSSFHIDIGWVSWLEALIIVVLFSDILSLNLTAI